MVLLSKPPLLRRLPVNTRDMTAWLQSLSGYPSRIQSQRRPLVVESRKRRYLGRRRCSARSIKDAIGLSG